VVRYPAGTPVPAWAAGKVFFSVTSTEDELSVVCPAEWVPDGVGKVEPAWRCLKVEGPLDFALTGILASLAVPLAAAKVSIFAISTFDTDYILVKGAQLASAKEALRRAGFTFTSASGRS